MNLVIELNRPAVQASRISAWLKFVAALLIIGIVWMVLLPIVESQPSVSEHIATQKRIGVDPSAMFYTELEIAPDIAHHVERLHDAHSSTFWSVSH